jgi:hypothetical protein
MNGFLSKASVERIKAQYPIGTRIELIAMEDPHAPIAPGTQGVVELVDSIGTLHMKWDNGRTLGIIPGEDQFKILSKPTEEKLEPEKGPTMGGMGM